MGGTMKLILWIISVIVAIAVSYLLPQLFYLFSK